MTLAVLLLMLVGLLVSLPLTALLVRAGHRAGTLDTSGAEGHDKTLRAVPNIGGMAIFIAIAAPIAVGIAAVWLVDNTAWQRWFPPLSQHIDRLRESTPTALALLAALAVLHVTGLVDDRRSLGPWIKLAIQLAAATVLAVWFDVRLLTLFGPVGSIIVTVLWIIAVTNAINFIDNMDGLAAGVAAIAAALFMAACLVNGQWFIASTLALTIGALAGFLVFNFPPARIFMGDGGSLVLGFLLGVLTARTTFYHDDLGGGWYGVCMPLVVLAIPLYDLVSVTLIRIRQGRNPFVGDQQHFSHRLVQRGLSPRGAVVVIWAATAVTGIAGVFLGGLEAWQAILVGLQTLLVLLMLALLEHASRHAVARDARP